jgi:hypothetical protein
VSYGGYGGYGGYSEPPHGAYGGYPGSGGTAPYPNYGSSGWPYYIRVAELTPPDQRAMRTDDAAFLGLHPVSGNKVREFPQVSDTGTRRVSRLERVRREDDLSPR